MLDAMEFGPSTRFSIDDLRVDPMANTLCRNGNHHHIEPKAMDLLRALANQHGEVATRDCLINTIWGIEYGGDESLSRAVSVLRKGLNTVGASKALVETVPKRGYRLTKSVAVDHAPIDLDASVAGRERVVRPSRSNFSTTAFALLAMIAGGSLAATAGWLMRRV